MQERGEWDVISSNKPKLVMAYQQFCLLFLGGCCQGWRVDNLTKQYLDRGVTYKWNRKGGDNVIKHLYGGA